MLSPDYKLVAVPGMFKIVNQTSNKYRKVILFLEELFHISNF